MRVLLLCCWALHAAGAPGPRCDAPLDVTHRVHLTSDPSATLKKAEDRFEGQLQEIQATILSLGPKEDYTDEMRQVVAQVEAGNSVAEAQLTGLRRDAATTQSRMAERAALEEAVDAATRREGEKLLAAARCEWRWSGWEGSGRHPTPGTSFLLTVVLPSPLLGARMGRCPHACPGSAQPPSRHRAPPGTGSGPASGHGACPTPPRGAPS
jgi:hypothetical protein